MEQDLLTIQHTFVQCGFSMKYDAGLRLPHTYKSYSLYGTVYSCTKGLMKAMVRAFTGVMAIKYWGSIIGVSAIRMALGSPTFKLLQIVGSKVAQLVAASKVSKIL